MNNFQPKLPSLGIDEVGLSEEFLDKFSNSTQIAEFPKLAFDPKLDYEKAINSILVSNKLLLSDFKVA